MSEIIFNQQPSALSQPSLQSQIDNLQTTLASLNQQVIFLQETIQEKDQLINELRSQTRPLRSEPSGSKTCEIAPAAESLTIVGLLINLYKFIFLPGKTS